MELDHYASSYCLYTSGLGYPGKSDTNLGSSAWDDHASNSHAANTCARSTCARNTRARNTRAGPGSAAAWPASRGSKAADAAHASAGNRGLVVNSQLRAGRGSDFQGWRSVSSNSRSPRLFEGVWSQREIAFDDSCSSDSAGSSGAQDGWGSDSCLRAEGLHGNR